MRGVQVEWAPTSLGIDSSNQYGQCRATTHEVHVVHLPSIITMSRYANDLLQGFTSVSNIIQYRHRRRATGFPERCQDINAPPRLLKRPRQHPSICLRIGRPNANRSKSGNPQRGDEGVLLQKERQRVRVVAGSPVESIEVRCSIFPDQKYLLRKAQIAADSVTVLFKIQYHIGTSTVDSGGDVV